MNLVSCGVMALPARHTASCLALLAVAVVALAPACDTNPYHAIGCSTTSTLPFLGRSGPTHGVVCVVSDSANDPPLCEKVAATYREKEHPTEEFGVMVHRRSVEATSCKQLYNGDGQLLGDLVGGE